MQVTIILNKSNEESIKSVLEQTHQDWHLLVVGETEVLDERMRCIEYFHPRDFKGEFVLMLRGGDRLLPNALVLMLEYAEEYDVIQGSTKEYKYKNPNRFSLHEKDLTLPEYSSEVLIRKDKILDISKWSLAEDSKHIHIQKPVVEKCFPQDVIEKWETQRILRQRRNMKMTVIFGVRNRARYARRVLRSLLVQDLPRDYYNIVIVDFGSTDGIQDYINQIRASNVKLVSVPNMSRYDRALAYNIGIKKSDADILVFSEADTLFPKYALRLIRDQMIEESKSYIKISKRNLDKLTTCTVISKTYSDYAALLTQAEETQDLGCLAIERSYVANINGFDEKYAGESFEVVDFIERLEQSGVEQQELKDINVLHMWHTEADLCSDGYFKHLYKRQQALGSPIRNEDREWGVISRKRPSILFMLSPNTWESGTIYKYVAEFLRPHYEINMIGARDELRGKTSGRYDIVYTSDWRFPRTFKSDTSKFVLGVFDYSWAEDEQHNIPCGLFAERIKVFEAISTPDEQLGNILVDYHPNTFHTPLGVDTELFRPIKGQRVSNKFTVGWVGPEKTTIEGFDEHIRPICDQLKDVQLFTAPGGEDTNGQMQMLGFYSAIDALVRFNESAGESKSVLEIMACGKPAITTKVGDVEKIIQDGYNGLIIPRSEEALVEALTQLQTKDLFYKNLGAMARDTAVQQWDWRDRAQHWKDFFDFVMEMG